MSSDPEKHMSSVSSPPVAAEGARSRAFALLLAAFGGAITLVWGFETIACKGVVAGAIAAAMRASFLALTHLPELGLQLLIFGAHFAVAYAATRRGPFRAREELLTMVLPVLSFVVGLAAASTIWAESQCALHPWR